MVTDALATAVQTRGDDLASVIANEYAEATSSMHLSALALVGLTLFATTFVLNSAARLFVWRVTQTKVAK